MILVGLIAIPVLIAVNGFFVAAEYALVAVRMTRVEELVQQGVRRARSVAAAKARLDRSIAELGPAAPETQAAIQRILLVARFDVAVLLLVVVDMVTKPFS